MPAKPVEGPSAALSPGQGVNPRPGQRGTARTPSGVSTAWLESSASFRNAVYRPIHPQPAGAQLGPLSVAAPKTFPSRCPPRAEEVSKA